MYWYAVGIDTWGSDLSAIIPAVLHTASMKDFQLLHFAQASFRCLFSMLQLAATLCSGVFVFLMRRMSFLDDDDLAP